jgi:hypothetical protein
LTIINRNLISVRYEDAKLGLESLQAANYMAAIDVTKLPGWVGLHLRNVPCKNGSASKAQHVGALAQAIVCSLPVQALSGTGYVLLWVCAHYTCSAGTLE